MKIKSQISYKDWLLLNRGEIKPEIGDKIIISGLSGSGMYNKTVRNFSFIEWKNSFKINISAKQYTYLEACYVEIDYNPNEAIEFAEWLINEQLNCSLYNRNGKWKYLQENNEITTEELYKQFKKEKYGK